MGGVIDFKINKLDIVMQLISSRALHLCAGPLLMLLCIGFQDVFGGFEASCAVGTVLWMAWWWIAAPVDLAVTALLPIVLNALLQMGDMKEVISCYASETILLLLGASILTASWEELGLDRRIATRILSMIGSNLRVQVASWFLFAALLSSVLPNAVVCTALTPIAVSMLRHVGRERIAGAKDASLLLLAIVFGTGVGGLGTPLGGAMNLVSVSYLERITGEEYLYWDWVKNFAPVMVIIALFNIVYLVSRCAPDAGFDGSREYFKAQHHALPKMSPQEYWSLGLFAAALVLSFVRPFYSALLPGLKPAYIFIGCGVLSFLVSMHGKALITWKTAQQKIVWRMMYVFAGGLAAGALIGSTGAAVSLGRLMASAAPEGSIPLCAGILICTMLMSNVTSNTATAAVSMPIVIALASGMGVSALPLVYVATIGMNLAYLFPTSIRAIPAGYGLEPKFMFRHGLPLTLGCMVIVSLLSYVLNAFWW